MQFSSKFTTAVHILLYLLEYQEEEKVTSEVLADTTGVNPVNIRKILASLKKAGLVTVHPGVGGAFLKEKAESITLREIFTAVEEPEQPLFRMHEHPNVNCPVGKSIKTVLDKRLDYVKEQMLQNLQSVRLSELFQDMKREIRKRKLEQ